MTTTWIDGKAGRKSQNCLWDSSFKALIFASNFDWWWKMGVVWTSQAQKSMNNARKPSTSTVQRWTNRSKVMLCIWWDQTGVLYHDLFKLSETVTGDRYQHQLLNLSPAISTNRPHCGLRHDKIILQHDNARPHLPKPVKETLKNWAGRFYLTRRTHQS